MQTKNENDITLKGQSTYSPDMKAFMLNENTMVIHGQEHQLAYLTKEQAMNMFGLVEPSNKTNKE